MRRRSFLAAIAAAFVAPDPEKLLWVPGKKLISIPVAQVALPEPVSLHARYLDVTTHSSTWPWREYLLDGYDVVFSDGKVLSSFGKTPPTRREARFQYRATFPPPGLQPPAPGFDSVGQHQRVVLPYAEVLR